MTRKPKIAHIVKIKGVSGAENHLLALLPRLTERYEIHLVMMVERGNRMDAFASKFERSGVPVRRIAIYNHYDLSVVWRLYRILMQIRPDLVHTHLIHGDVYGLIAAKLAGVPKVVSSKHGYDDYDSTSLLYRVNGFLSRWMDGVVTISHALQKKVACAEGISLEKMRTIHYGLEERDFSAGADRWYARRLLGIGDDTALIGSVGRLIPVKGYDYLLKALAGIDGDFKLIILGDGPLKAPLARQVTELGLDDRVELMGFRADVAKILCGLDLFVLPTLGEGFGLVILEAMAFGLPVVSTNAMAIPEIVLHGETGLLVPPKDSAALGRALKELLNSPNRRQDMGRKGLARLKLDFSVDRMVSETLAFYRCMMAPPSCPTGVGRSGPREKRHRKSM